MLDMRGIFSESYNEFLERKDKVRSWVLKAKDELQGSKLYDKPIDTRNPEEIIAALYLMYKDKQAFHEEF